MKHQKLVLTGMVLTAIISVLPIFDDPYHQEGKVCFWTWLYRELYELINGEQ